MADTSFKDQVTSSLVKAIANKTFNQAAVTSMIEIPRAEFGDFAFPCYALAKIYKKAPPQIASQIAEAIKLPKTIAKVSVLGAYVNFFVDKQHIAKKVMSEIIELKDSFGRSGKTGKTIMVEFFSCQYTQSSSCWTHPKHLPRRSIIQNFRIFRQ